MKMSLKETLSNILWELFNSAISYVDVNLGTQVIGGAGYTSISQYRPSHSGILLCCLPLDFGSVNNHTAWGVNCNGSYLYGTGGATITNVQLRYIFVGGGST